MSHSKRVAVKPENVELTSYSMMEQKPENSRENTTALQHGKLKILNYKILPTEDSVLDSVQLCL